MAEPLKIDQQRPKRAVTYSICALVSDQDEEVIYDTGPDLRQRLQEINELDAD